MVEILNVWCTDRLRISGGWHHRHLLDLEIANGFQFGIICWSLNAYKMTCPKSDRDLDIGSLGANFRNLFWSTSSPREHHSTIGDQGLSTLCCNHHQSYDCLGTERPVLSQFLWTKYKNFWVKHQVKFKCKLIWLFFTSNKIKSTASKFSICSWITDRSTAMSCDTTLNSPIGVGGKLAWK